MAPRLMSSITTNESIHLSVASSISRASRTDTPRRTVFGQNALLHMFSSCSVRVRLVLVKVMGFVSDISMSGMSPLRSCTSVLQQ